MTDGEFCSLRTQGETRPLHVWQVIHDAKDSACGMSKTVLLEMLIQIGGKNDVFTINFVFFEEHFQKSLLVQAFENIGLGSSELYNASL